MDKKAIEAALSIVTTPEASKLNVVTMEAIKAYKKNRKTNALA